MQSIDFAAASKALDLHRAVANDDAKARSNDSDAVKTPGLSMPVGLIELLRERCAALNSSLAFNGYLEVLPAGNGHRYAVESDAATLISLIVGEAVSNAIKYSHPTGVIGRIIVACRFETSGDELVIEVIDDGVGLPENFDPVSARTCGLRLMHALSDRLEAKLTFDSTALGLRVRLRIPNLRSEGEWQIPLPRFTSPDGFLQLLDALPAAVYTTDAAGRITYYNRAAVELAGREPQIGSDEWCVSWRLLRADGAALPHDECPMAIALKEDRAIHGAEAIAERPDGTQVPFMAFPTPLHDASGKLIGAVNMLVAVGDRQHAGYVAHRLAAIVDSSDDAILSKDLDGIIQSWNYGAQNLFGYTADETIGRPVTILIPESRLDEEPTILERIRRGERIEHYETVRVRKDGSLIDISLSVSPVKDAGGRIVGASKIARDITERKRAQARHDMLMREIQHRTKNLFAVIQSVVSRSFTGKDSVSAAKEAVLGRIHALAQTHVLTANGGHGADIHEVVLAEIEPYADGRIEVAGPSVILAAQTVQNIALAVHELATNAAKYGALSDPRGKVRIAWSVHEESDGLYFAFRWREQGGPRVTAPEQKGFGSTVLEKVMAEYFDAPRIDFAEEGIIYELKSPLDSIVEHIGAAAQDVA